VREWDRVRIGDLGREMLVLFMLVIDAETAMACDGRSLGSFKVANTIQG
jgi:hypothetical protein